MAYNTVRSPPSPHTHRHGEIDYQRTLPRMMSQATFALNPVQVFPHNGPFKRGVPSNLSEPTTTLRSPVLEEFRGNKARGWELKVDIYCLASEFQTYSKTYLITTRISSVMLSNLAETNMGQGSFNRNWRVPQPTRSKESSTRLFLNMPFHWFKTCLETM